MGSGRTLSVSSLPTLLTDPRLIAVLLVQFVGLFGANVPPPTLSGMALDMGVTEGEISLVMAVFAVPGVVMVPVVGVLADIVGRRRIVLGSLFLLGVAGVAISFADSFALVLALRGLQGVGFAGTTPITVAIIGDLYSGARGSTAQGYRMSVSGATSVVVPAVAGYLVHFSWRYSYLVYALVLVVMGVVYVALPETLDREERASGAKLTETLGVYWRSLRSELRDADLGVLFFGALVQYSVKYGVFTFVPLFVIRELGASAFVAGMLISLYGAVRIVVAPLSGRVVSLFGQRDAIVYTAAVTGVGTGLFAVAPDVYVVGGAMIVYCVGDSLLAPVLNDMTTKKASPEHRGGLVSGLNMMKISGQAVGPAVLGVLLVATSYQIVFVATALLLVPFALLVLVILDPRA